MQRVDMFTEQIVRMDHSRWVRESSNRNRMLTLGAEGDHDHRKYGYRTSGPRKLVAGRYRQIWKSIEEAYVISCQKNPAYL